MRLLAWIAYTAPGFMGAGPAYEACLVSEETPQREPASRPFATEAEARAWIETEAAALEAPVVWRKPAAAAA